MSLFDKNQQQQDIPEYSLKAIKDAIKVAKATSPEREELIYDLEYIADTIEKNKDEATVCNRAICARYPEIFNVAENYGLYRIAEEKLNYLPINIQIVILHRMAHYLRNKLTSETVEIKGEIIIEEVAKSALGYALKQVLSD